MQTLACWIVLWRGNVYVRGEPVLWNSLKLNCHWCFNKGLRTSLYGEIIACWNKNSVERRREMPKMSRFMIFPQRSLPFDSVKICICTCVLNVMGKSLHGNKSRRSTHETCNHTWIHWVPNLWWEECDVGRVSEDETISFSIHLKWVKRALVVRTVDEHSPAWETKKVYLSKISKQGFREPNSGIHL